MANDKDFIVKNGIQATGNLTVNTVTAGTWQGTVITGQYGGTGVNNVGKSITIGGNIVTANSFTTANNYALTLTTTAATNVTLPTTGTLATLGGTETLTAKTLTSPTINSGALSGTFTSASSINLNIGGTVFSNTLIMVDRGSATYSDGFSIRSGTAAAGNPALFIKKASATGFNMNGWNGTSQEGSLALVFPSGVSTSADLTVGADLIVTANVGIGSSLPSSTSLLNVSKVLTSDDSTNGTNIYIVDSNTAMTAARTKTGIKSSLSIANQNKNADGLTSYTSEYLAGYFPVSHGSSSALDAYASSIRGVRGLVSSYTNATTPTAAAVDAWVYQAGGGNISAAFGVTALVGASNNSVTGTITTAQGVRSVIISNTAMNIGTGYLFWGQHSGSNTTTKYGVYVTGEANNYFSGNLAVGGDVTVTGNLNINGTTIVVKDNNIELGSVASPSNTTANGGGITLKGTTEKTFNWINATSSWTSSENLDLVTGKQYTINNILVANSTTLGSTINSSNLTSVGTIGNGVWQGTIVGSTYGGTGVNNAGRTITLGGNIVTANTFTTANNFALTLTTTGATNVTLPTTGTLATTGNLAQFAATTSSQLAGVISDETGSGNLVFSSAATLTGTTLNGNTTFAANVIYADTVNQRVLFGANIAYATRTTGAASATSQVQIASNNTISTGLKFNALHYTTSGSNGARIQVGHSANDTIGSHSTLVNGDVLGDYQFVGSDGAEFILGASIIAQVDGTPAIGLLPTSLAFRTSNNTSSNTPVTTRMTIAANGNVGIGTTAPDSALQVSGTIKLSGAFVENVFTVTGTTPDLSPVNGTIQKWTLTAASTPVAPTNWPSGSAMTMMIDDGTAYSINWTSIPITWVSKASSVTGTAPALSTTNWTILTLWKVGTTYYGSLSGYA